MSCTEYKKPNNNIVESKIGTLVKHDEVKLTEYIIVLNEGAVISDSIKVFNKYQVEILKDLKRNRYVIGLMNDPGMKVLLKEIEQHGNIKLIQPNYRYQAQ